MFSNQLEEVNDFSNDDARVLGDLDSQIYGASSLPRLGYSVKRRGKRKKRKIKSSKKTREKKISKRSVKGKQRRKRLKSKRTTKEKNSSTGLKSRRRVPREPVTRLSLLGAELEPVADPLVTENSRRFDQPLIHRKESVIDEKPTVDSWYILTIRLYSIEDSNDLLGSIIPEQIKTLAPGRLFAVKGGRFNSTENFEKYKIKKTNQLSLELRERLGITTNTERSSNLETAGKTSMVRHPTDRKESSCLDDKRLAGSVPSEFRKIGDPDGRLKSKGSEIFQRDQHKSVSTVIHQHQHSNNKQQSSDRHSIKRIATDIYRNDVAQNLCESINERKSQAGMSRGSYKYKGTQNLYMDRTKGYDHPHNEFEHSNCSSSKGISRNEESEQEDHGSFLKTLVDGRTTSGLQKNVSMDLQKDKKMQPGCQSTSESNLLVKNNLEVKNNSIFLCENSKQKADDILKIIDGFAKEGIKPYKREITVQDYKDVMRAVVRECYKKRILDETSIKYKVQQHVAAIRESKLQSHERHPSERTDTERSIELALPSKRFKTDK
ncbi:hypothetical protein DICVIV_08493 [Dictyocaulus viviparus]|uniref:Uncharacterized protein n=1 Tax=Dictyocaulus viviparus TaxID=29172 RepID=A0A0D8XNS5_DICVI|nr:hypothetical protein DICVIV_08493 [Dictyocaulus viviparus]